MKHSQWLFDIIIKLSRRREPVRRMKCTKKCGGKLLQLVIKCKSPDKECCTLPELWAAPGKGAARSPARSCQTVSQVNWGQAGGPAELILIPVAASHGNVFCCSHCGYKKCLFHVFKSRHVVALRCLLGFCFCFFSSASSGSLPPKCCVHCRQTQTHAHTHSQVRLILFIYSALPGESALQSVYLAACLHKHCLAGALFTHETRRLSITWHLKP